MNQNSAVLITGCSTGIGRCVAYGLQQRGYRVFATARKHRDVEELRQQGFEALQLDVANPASIDTAVAAMLDKTGGRIYGLFNNAGYGQAGAVEDLSRDVLREQFEVNLFGLHELTTLIIPVMRKCGAGRIIQNSSILGFIAMKYRGAYNASKFALEGLTDTLRLELKGSGVHVSLIEPGPITSAFRKNSLATFDKNIDIENSAHKDIYRAVLRRLEAVGDNTIFTLGPEAVLAKVIHALESKKPRARYYVTVPTYAFGFMKRFLPTGAMDWVLAKASGAENK